MIAVTSCPERIADIGLRPIGPVLNVEAWEFPHHVALEFGQQLVFVVFVVGVRPRSKGFYCILPVLFVAVDESVSLCEVGSVLLKDRF